MTSSDGRSTLECLLEEDYQSSVSRWESSPAYFSGGVTPSEFPPSSGNLSAQMPGWPENVPPRETSPFRGGFPPGTSPPAVPPWTSAPFPGHGDLETAMTRAFPGQPIVINHYHYHNAQSFDPPPPAHFPHGPVNQHQGQTPTGPCTPLQVQSSPPGYTSPVSERVSPQFYGSLPSDGYLTRSFNRAETNFNPVQAPTRSPAFPVSHSKPLTLYPGLSAADSPETSTYHTGFPTNRPLTQVLSQKRSDVAHSAPDPGLGAHKRPGSAEGEPKRKRARARSAPPSWCEVRGEAEPPGQVNPFSETPYDHTAALRELENSWLGPFANPFANPFENPIDAGSQVDPARSVISQPASNPVTVPLGKEAKERSVAVTRAPRLSNFLQGALNRFVANDPSGYQGDQGSGGHRQ